MSHTFLDYTGKVERINNQYEFKMNKSKKLLEFNYFSVYNPTFDNTFKKIFKVESILLSFLNDILYPNEYRIKKVQLLNSNINGPYGKYSKGSCNLDLPCICFFDGKSDKKNKNESDRKSSDDDEEMENEEETIKLALTDIYELVVDVEMQKIIDESPSDRFIKYMSYLNANILNKKILILVLLIKNAEDVCEKSSKSAKINYTKKSMPKYKTLKEYDSHVIIEVDLNYCYNLIKKKKSIWIVDKERILSNKGKEWIKFLTMQLWCSSFEKEVYVFPNLENLYFNQPQIKHALQILNVIDPMYGTLIEQELGEIDKIKEIKKLKQLNQEKDKSIQEKDKSIQEKDKTLKEKENLIIKLSEENKKYKNLLNSLGVINKEKTEDKSLDDIDYYEDEKDLSIIGEEEEDIYED